MLKDQKLTVSTVGQNGMHHKKISKGAAFLNIEDGNTKESAGQIAAIASHTSGSGHLAKFERHEVVALTITFPDGANWKGSIFDLRRVLESVPGELNPF